MGLGFDAGTYNLVCCHRDDKGNFVNKREVNAFVELPLEDRFMFNMMKATKTPEFPDGIPIIELADMAFVLGEAAVSMAYTLSNLELKRPMHEGCVNPKEKDAFQILSIMIHSLIEGPKKNKEALYYSVPANALNSDTDATYHQKILQSIFNAFKSDEGHRVDAHPISEGLALVYAELAKKAYTGVGISFGAGMVNLCFSMYGNPVFQFALVNSGDWIDRQAAKATQESPAFINKQKHKIDLTKEPAGLIERAIQTQYRIMIETTVKGIKDGLTQASKKVRADQPVDIVVAGGTSSPPGFAAMFKEAVTQAKMPIPIGEIIQPADPLYSVARGCLIAAEASNK